MYQPTHFVQTDPAALAALMREHPLATLVRQAGDGTLAADLIPLRWRPDADGLSGRLQGHVARANPLWREADGQPVLAQFQGPQAYISPAWYPSKAETGKVVPTWNYTVVQAHGRLQAIDDIAWLRRFVSELTDAHEAGRARPWRVDEAPDDYLGAMLRAIVGIEIRVQRLEGKWKISQNRSDADRLGTAAGLAAEPDEAARQMAEWVRGGTAAPR